MNRDALRLVMLASAAVLFGVALYFYMTGNVVLGATLLAMALMEVAVSFVLTRRR